MGTRVKGTASFTIDFWVDEDLNDLEAEHYFNDTLDALIRSGSDDFGGDSTADYNQTHEFGVTEDGEEDEEGMGL